MSGRGRQIKIEILGDARDAQKAFDSLEKSSEGLGKKLGTVASIASGFILAEGLMRLPGLFRDTVDAGSNLAESVNAVNQIFGDSAREILYWGENNANAFGLSQRAFNDLAVPLGAGLKNAGLSMDEVTGHTITLTERAADMASVFNTDVDEALAAIQAGLRGEADPLERFGVGLSAAAVEAEALAMSGKTVASELTNQEKALARVNLIMKQTEDVAGDFANTSDGVANSARIAAARQEELAAVIGTQLLPIQQALTQAKLAFLEVLATKVIPAVIAFSDSLQKRLRPIIESFIKGPLKDAREAFDDLGELWDDMPKSLGELQDALGDISFEDVTSGLAGIGGRIVGAISGSLDSVDWAGVRGKIAGGLSVGFSFTADKAQAIVDGISTAFDKTDWSAVRTKVTEGLFGGISAAQAGATNVGQSVVDNINMQLQGVDWTAVQTTIRDGVLGGLSTAQEGATGAGEQIQTWIASELEAVEDWTRLGSAVKGGVIAGITAVSGVAGLTVAITDWIAREITSGEGDWSTIASSIATKIGEGFAEAVSIAEDLAGWIKKSLEEVDWQATADAVAAGIAGALANVQGLAQGVADSIGKHIGSVDWSGTDWEAASDGMTASLGASLQSSFTDAFGEVNLEAVVRDSGLVLTPELLFGDGGLMDTLRDVKDEIGDIARVLEEELGPTLEDAREAWEEWEPILGPLVGLIADLNISALIILIESMLLPLKLAAEALQIFFEATQTALDGIEFLGGAIHDFAEGIGVITGWSETATEAIVGWAETSVEKAGEFLDGMLGPIDEMAISGAKTISGFVTDSVGKLGEFVTDAARKAEEIASGVVDGLKNLLSIDASVGGVGQFVKFGLEAGKKIAGIATEAVGWASDIAWAFIQGLIDNMTSFEALNRVYDAAKDLGQSMLDGAKGILGIDSPSKEGYAIGQFFYQGMIEGILDGEDGVYQAGHTIGGAAAAGASDGWTQSAGALPMPPGTGGSSGGALPGTPGGGAPEAGWTWDGSFWNQGPPGVVSDNPPSIEPEPESGTAASGGSGGTVGVGTGGGQGIIGPSVAMGYYWDGKAIGTSHGRTAAQYLEWLSVALERGVSQVKVTTDGIMGGIGITAGWYPTVTLMTKFSQGGQLLQMQMEDSSNGASLSTASSGGVSGFGGPNIVQNFTLRRADPDEIAHESRMALRFAALSPSLVGNLPS